MYAPSRGPPHTKNVKDTHLWQMRPTIVRASETGARITVAAAAASTLTVVKTVRAVATDEEFWIGRS